MWLTVSPAHPKLDQSAGCFGVSEATEKWLRLPDGRKFSIRDHFYPLDDVYCYVNGWYDLPRAKVAQNWTYLEEAARQLGILHESAPFVLLEVFAQATGKNVFRPWKEGGT